MNKTSFESSIATFADSISSVIVDGARKLPDSERIPYVQTEVNKIEGPGLRGMVETLVLFKLSKSSPREIIVCIHGMNTRGVWQTDFRNLFIGNANVEVIPVSYGWFNPVYFWIPFMTRLFPLQYVADQILNIQNCNRKDNLSIVCHSFGTYLIGKILQKYTYISINKLVLSGCVLKEKFDWDRIVTKPVRIINEVGVKDYWPLAAKSLSWGYGSSGLYGFGNHLVFDRFHDKNHSGFFEGTFMSDFWVPLFNNNIEVPSTFKRKTPNILLEFAPIIGKLIVYGLLIFASSFFINWGNVWAAAKEHLTQLF